MVHINALSFALLASSAVALPHFGQHGKFPTLNVTSAHGVFPTGTGAPTGTAGHAWPTGTGFPLPTGGHFPGFKKGDLDLDKRTDKKDKADKKKHQLKPTGWALPTGSGSWPAPTGTIPGGFKKGDLGVPKQPFGVARREFKPHWGGSPAGKAPAPTGTGAAAPTGTATKTHKKDHKKDHDKRDDDDSDKKQKKEKSDKKDKKKDSKKSKKPSGVAKPTGGFPAPTGILPAPTGVLPARSVDEFEGEQERQFGAVRREAFQPHWAGAPKGKHPLPTATSPPSPTGTGSHKPHGTGKHH